MISSWRWARPNVVLSRAARAGDAPALASRWLQTAEDICRRRTGGGNERCAATAVLQWARDLDLASTGARLRRAPAPNPAARAGGRGNFSVTEIETLRRDPYAVYARRILRAGAAGALAARSRGRGARHLFHDIVHRIRHCPASIPSPPRRKRSLIEIGRRAVRSKQPCRPTSTRSGGRASCKHGGKLHSSGSGVAPPASSAGIAEARAQATPVGATRRHAFAAVPTSST
jgi:hypothetical protein